MRFLQFSDLMMTLRVPQEYLGFVRVALASMVIAVCVSALPGHVTLADENQTRVADAVSDATAAAEEEYQRVVLPILEQYCFGCHAAGCSRRRLFIRRVSFGRSDDDRHTDVVVGAEKCSFRRHATRR